MTRKTKKTRYLALLLAGIITLETGCSFSNNGQKLTPEETSVSETTVAETLSSESQKEHEKFEAFTAELFRESVSVDTVTLHYALEHPENYGITDYEVTLGEILPEGSDEVVAEIQSTLDDLSEFQYDLLPENDRLVYDILYAYLNTSMEGQNFPYYEDLFSPIMGIHGTLPTIMAEYTLRTEQDIEEYLTLVEEIPSYMNQAIHYEETRAKLGMVMPDSSIDTVVAACKDFVNAGEDNILIESFEERLESFPDLSEEKKEEYLQRNSEIVLKKVIPSYQSIMKMLSQIKGTGEEALGLSHMENGSEYYSYLLKSLVGSGHTPEELIDLTQERLDAQLQEFFDIISEDNEVLTNIITPPEETRTPEEILEELKELSLEDYPALTVEETYEVKYVSESMESSSAPAFYMIPPYDAPEENTIYINRSSTDSSTLFSTLAHEGYPGHLYQTVYSATKFTSPLRQVIDFSGYVEGWGLYVEHESYAMNRTLTDTSENLARAMELNSAMSLAIYALVDLHIHYDGWSREEVGEFVADYFGPLDDETLNDFYNTIISEPAYYLKYYVGYLEIHLLREKAQEKLGDAFDLKEFHQFLLDLGPAPFPLIEEYMDANLLNK